MTVAVFVVAMYAESPEGPNVRMFWRPFAEALLCKEKWANAGFCLFDVRLHALQLDWGTELGDNHRRMTNGTKSVLQLPLQTR